MTNMTNIKKTKKNYIYKKNFLKEKNNILIYFLYKKLSQFYGIRKS